MKPPSNEYFIKKSDLNISEGWGGNGWNDTDIEAAGTGDDFNIDDDYIKNTILAPWGVESNSASKADLEEIYRYLNGSRNEKFWTWSKGDANHRRIGYGRWADALRGYIDKRFDPKTGKRIEQGNAANPSTTNTNAPAPAAVAPGQGTSGSIAGKDQLPTDAAGWEDLRYTMQAQADAMGVPYAEVARIRFGNDPQYSHLYGGTQQQAGGAAPQAPAAGSAAAGQQQPPTGAQTPAAPAAATAQAQPDQAKKYPNVLQNQNKTPGAGIAKVSSAAAMAKASGLRDGRDVTESRMMAARAGLWKGFSGD